MIEFNYKDGNQPSIHPIQPGTNYCDRVGPYGGGVCLRPKGHPGVHEAHGLNNESVARWYTGSDQI